MAHLPTESALTRYNDAVEEEDMDRTPMTGRVSTRTQERLLGLENELQELLPGIPDEVTLNHITTKLRWTEVRILPSLGRAWNRAIQSREVHCARVQSHSTETVVVVTGTEFIALYSMGAKKFYLLPSIPGVDRFVECHCVSLDSRVYILGARERERYHIASDSIYVVELVEQRKWKKLANMPQPVHGEFECGIVDGKIYVFGLMGHRNILMVYDPKVNAWSPIMPMPDLFWDVYWDHDVEVVGGELFLHSGYNNSASYKTLVLDVYNPVRNDWRKVETGRMDSPERKQVFVADGEFHVMTESAIYRLDTENNSWTEIHSFSVFGLWDDEIIMHPMSVLAANGELVAIVCSRGWADSDRDFESCLLQSKGFGGENKVLVWEKVNWSVDLVDSLRFSPVQL